MPAKKLHYGQNCSNCISLWFMWHLSNHKFALESLWDKKGNGKSFEKNPFFYGFNEKVPTKCNLIRNVQPKFLGFHSIRQEKKEEMGEDWKALNHNSLKNVWTYKKSPPSGHDWTLWTKKKGLLLFPVLEMRKWCPGFLHEKNSAGWTIFHPLSLACAFSNWSFWKGKFSKVTDVANEG